MSLDSYINSHHMIHQLFMKYFIYMNNYSLVTTSDSSYLELKNMLIEGGKDDFHKLPLHNRLVQ